MRADLRRRLNVFAYRTDGRAEGSAVSRHRLALGRADPDGRVAGRHARIWLPEGGFVLHHLAGGRYATVLGEKPLRWAAQEDGGEIVIRPHQLRFDSVVSSK